MKMMKNKRNFCDIPIFSVFFKPVQDFPGGIARFEETGGIAQIQGGRAVRIGRDCHKPADFVQCGLRLRVAFGFKLRQPVEKLIVEKPHAGVEQPQARNRFGKSEVASRIEDVAVAVREAEPRPGFAAVEALGTGMSGAISRASFAR